MTTREAARPGGYGAGLVIRTFRVQILLLPLDGFVFGGPEFNSCVFSTTVLNTLTLKVPKSLTDFRDRDNFHSIKDS